MIPKTPDWARTVVNRPEAAGVEWEWETFTPLLGKVLVTGGEGSIGSALAQCIPGATSADIDVLDVRDPQMIMTQLLLMRPKTVLHLAGAKHAPLGEEDPYEATRTNVLGTANILEWARRVGARVVVASTCKACDPETAYGATKLIAERMTLNAGQMVVRYYNVVETSGNVFQLWEKLPEEEPIPFTACTRRFMSRAEAIALTLWAAVENRAGRYALTGVHATKMEWVAEDLYPGREKKLVMPRRGDRHDEPMHALCEQMEPVRGSDWVSQVTSPYDSHERKEST